MGSQDAAIRKILFPCLLAGIIIAVGDFKILSFFKSNAWALKGDAESDRGNASAIETEINNHVHILPQILKR